MTEENRLKAPLADHLANERTFLAWVRTAIAIMGFGFVVVKFSIFIKQISLTIGRPPQGQSNVNSHLIGISLVALGSAIIIFSYFRYITTAEAIIKGTYYNPQLLIKMLALAIFIISLGLLYYLLLSV